MDHLDAIRKQRASGRVLGGAGEQAASVGDAASAFGLKGDPGTYREVDEALAREILVGVLHRDLAYGTRLMSLSTAESLAGDFLAKLVEPGAKFFTNGEFRRDAGAALVMSRWNPATASTFDTGVLALGKTASACLWVAEDG
jgi:hypothetical protein